MSMEIRCVVVFFFFFSSRRRHTRWTGDWSSDVCSSDLEIPAEELVAVDLQRPGARRARDQQLARLAQVEPEPPGQRESLAQRHRVEREIGRASCRERV